MNRMTLAIANIDRGRVIHTVAALVFSASGFLLAVLCNLNWTSGHEAAIATAMASLSFAAAMLMHRFRPDDTVRIVGYVLTQCASITVLLQFAFFLFRA